MIPIRLSKQEETWLLKQRVTRLTDEKEVLIYPMGAERYLSSILSCPKKERYNIRQEIAGKHVLVIPGYGNSGFLFAEAGAKSVTIVDKDPVTIAWMKAFKKFYHYREYKRNGAPHPSIGDLLSLLTYWYPPFQALPQGKLSRAINWIINPKGLRRSYIFYMLNLVQKALLNQVDGEFELKKDIQFHTSELEHLTMAKRELVFDTAFIPYLLGVRNGIEQEEKIIQFIEKLTQLVPKGPILITPSRSIKEFYILGQRYFEIPNYLSLQSIPQLKDYFVTEDLGWFRTQGLAMFRAKI